LFPLQNVVVVFVRAFIVGNPCIIIPSCNTPLSSVYFVELLREAGLPELWCQVLIIANNSTIASIVDDPRVSISYYFGAARVGWQLCASGKILNKRVFQYNSTTPVIIESDFDATSLVLDLSGIALHHSGQVRNSLQHIFCHKNNIDSFVKNIVDHISHLVVGDPLSNVTDIGSLILKQEVIRVHQWVTEARSAGSEILIGGSPLSESCYSPTIICSNTPESLNSSQQEIQAPVLCVYPYEELDAILPCLQMFPNTAQMLLYPKRFR